MLDRGSLQSQSIISSARRRFHTEVSAQTLTWVFPNLTLAWTARGLASDLLVKSKLISEGRALLGLFMPHAFTAVLGWGQAGFREKKSP